MKHLKPLMICAALAVSATSGAALAQSGLTQLQSQAAHALKTYGYQGVDVTQLNSAQLAQIRHLANGNKGVGDIRGQIGAVLDNRIVNFLRN